VGSAGGVEVPGADRDGSGPTGADLRDGAYLRVRERAENFPVALRVLPRRLRTHLGAVYDVARVVDDLGDAAPGDRTAQLEAFSADLATIWAGGTPRAPVLRRLAGTVHACDLPREPFDRLVRANLVDQRVTRYPTFADLLGYCELSAEPVGRIVLAVFGASTPRRVAWSDRICTALQLIEHWQDVAEDRRAGRIYLPVEDLDRFGVREGDLDAPADRAAARSVPALRELIAFEAGRAREMLVSGLPLLGELRGWARLAITGYAAGGLAAVDGLRRAGWEVLPGSPGVRRSDLVRRITWLLTLRRAAS
jgi:squalene synthase HpnC